jgi:heme oxygenase
MTATIMRRLREQTRTWHDALEATSFSLALRNHTLPLDRYAGQLAAYRVILDALETRLSTSDDESVAAVWRPDLAKVPLLTRDLEFFGTSEFPSETLDVARRCAAAIHGLEPVALLGFLYVLEGSTLGALDLSRHVRATYDLTGEDGLAYYDSGDRDRWAGFSARMNACLVCEPVQERVIAAAGTAYQWIAVTLTTLEPAQVGVPRVVTGTRDA